MGSFPRVDLCPPPDRPEYAFIGRSNVGKSSLINMLTGRKALARVSNTPGKTQAINIFDINEAWYLTDLPGYGYAQRSKRDRAAWERMVRDYLVQRENLVLVFQLIDSRIPAQKNDLAFMRWMGEQAVPFVLCYTKSDKVKKIGKNIQAIERDILREWQYLPMNFITSAEKRTGRDALLQQIATWNAEWQKADDMRADRAAEDDAADDQR